MPELRRGVDFNSFPVVTGASTDRPRVMYPERRIRKFPLRRFTEVPKLRRYLRGKGYLLQMKDKVDSRESMRRLRMMSLPQEKLSVR